MSCAGVGWSARSVSASVGQAPSSHQPSRCRFAEGSFRVIAGGRRRVLCGHTRQRGRRREQVRFFESASMHDVRGANAYTRLEYLYGCKSIQVHAGRMQTHTGPDTLDVYGPVWIYICMRGRTWACAVRTYPITRTPTRAGALLFLSGCGL